MKTVYADQSSVEKITYDMDVTVSLHTSETISSVATTHVTYPSGAALTITNTHTSPIAYVTVPTGLAVGTNVVQALVTTNQGNIIGMEWVIVTRR
jgi:hypothetical protein